MTFLRRLLGRRRRPIAPEDPTSPARSAELAAELHTHAAALTAIADELARIHGVPERRAVQTVPSPNRRAGDNKRP